MVRSLVGTVNWQAPELWQARPKYDHKVDVFSCAMVFWEILTWHWKEKKYPWEGMNEHAIYETVGAKRQRCALSFCKVMINLLTSLSLTAPLSVAYVSNGLLKSSDLWSVCGRKTLTIGRL